MTQLERADLHAAIEIRYPDNTTEDITPKDLRDGLHELVDSVFVTATDTGAVPNVPEYKAGTFYVVGFTVRYTPVGGSEGFYAAKTAGKHTAPGSGNYVDWRVVPGPVTPTALSQELTLSQAQGLDQAGVVAGREYLIDCGPDANGHQQTVTVRGIANEFYDVEGTVEVNGVRTAITDFKVQAGTWTVKQYGAGSGTVKSVNGQAPDAQGDVQIPTSAPVQVDGTSIIVNPNGELAAVADTFLIVRFPIGGGQTQTIDIVHPAQVGVLGLTQQSAGVGVYGTFVNNVQVVSGGFRVAINDVVRVEATVGPNGGVAIYQRTGL